MTSLICILPTLLAGGSSQMSVNMSISLDGEPIGHGVMRSEVDAKGRMHQSVTSTMKVGEMTREMKDVSLAAKTGRPIEETEVDTVGSKVIKVVLKTGAKTLTVLVTTDGQTKTLKVPIPKGNLADKSSFWFIASKPKVGESVSYIHYDFMSWSWKKKTMTYVGDDLVPETSIKAHHVKMSDGDEWLDDKGKPLRAEQKLDSGESLLAVRE